MGRLQRILPPFIYNRLVKPPGQNAHLKNHGWKGNYSSWQDAQNNSKGYESEAIVQKVRESSLLVKNGIFAYERDSVLFDNIQYNQPLLTVLGESMATNDEELIVVDFGGSLGSTYRQNKDILLEAGKVTWVVVEQKAFVEIGKKEFEDENLKFEFTIEDALEKYRPNTILLSSVLQYLEKPNVIINEIFRHGFENVIIDRTAFIDDQERITVQHVPEAIYPASYPCRFFNENEFISKLSSHYELRSEFKSFCDQDFISEDDKKLYWKGFYFRQKH